MSLMIYGKDIKDMPYEEIEDFIKKLDDKNKSLEEENLNLKIENHDLKYCNTKTIKTIVVEEWDYQAIIIAIVAVLFIIACIYNLKV